LAFDIPNWIAVLIELGIGIAIAIVVYKLQSRTSKLAEELLSKISSMTSRVDAILEQRRLDEQSKKMFECKRIIDHLDYIQTEKRTRIKGIFNLVYAQ
jgi:hypothetical protein